MIEKVVADRASTIYRRGWPTGGTEYINSREPMRWESDLGAMWEFVGIDDLEPLWRLLDHPFLEATFDPEENVFRVQVPSVRD